MTRVQLCLQFQVTYANYVLIIFSYYSSFDVQEKTKQQLVKIFTTIQDYSTREENAQVKHKQDTSSARPHKRSK